MPTATKEVTVSDRIRKDMPKIAERYKGGESLREIARTTYKCNYKLVERLMKQELPVEFFVSITRERIKKEKKKYAKK